MTGAALWLRVLGVVVIVLGLAVLEPGGTSLGQRVGVPAVLAVGAWALVRNLAAVALGTAVLAAIHSEPGAADPVTGVIYPAAATAAGLVLVVIFVRRFRARILATRAARWAPRHRDIGAQSGSGSE